MAHVHDTGVVQLVIRFQHRHQHSVLATFLAAVGIQLRKEVFIAVLRLGRIRLVLHLEHDTDVLESVCRLVPEDEITLCRLIVFVTDNSIVILMELRVREERMNAHELIVAVLLQTLA